MLRQYEDKLYSEGKKYVLGIDEAGRGPLAGPLVIAGVILPPLFNNELINDSKQLSLKKREQLYELILKEALEVKILVVDVETIDSLNIYQATLDGMQRLIKLIDLKYDAVLVDAMPVKSNRQTISLIKGDQLSISIAAASVIAKVTRDKLMLEIHEKYPLYDFKNNKGYGTKKHLIALKQLGPCKEHRQSFKPVQDANQLFFDV